MLSPSLKPLLIPHGFKIILKGLSLSAPHLTWQSHDPYASFSDLLRAMWPCHGTALIVCLPTWWDAVPIPIFLNNCSCCLFFGTAHSLSTKVQLHSFTQSLLVKLIMFSVKFSPSLSDRSQVHNNHLHSSKSPAPNTVSSGYPSVW